MVHVLETGNLVSKRLHCAVGIVIYECAWAYCDSSVPSRLGHSPAVWQQTARELCRRQGRPPPPPSPSSPSKPWWCEEWARRTWSLTGAFSHDGSCTAAVVHRSQYNHILSVSEDGIVPLQTKTFKLCRISQTNIVHQQQGKWLKYSLRAAFNFFLLFNQNKRQHFFFLNYIFGKGCLVWCLLYFKPSFGTSGKYAQERRAKHFLLKCRGVKATVLSKCVMLCE